MERGNGAKCSEEDPEHLTPAIWRSATCPVQKPKSHHQRAVLHSHTMASKDMFDDDDDNDGPELATDATLGLNKDYAARFEKRKKKQELSRLQQLHGDQEDSEDAESEDEDGELLTRDLDLQIFKTIDKLRSKDSGIYDPSKQWFEHTGTNQDRVNEMDDEMEDAPASGGGGEGSSQAKPRGKEAKPAKVTLKSQLLEHGAEALNSDDEDDADRMEDSGGGGGGRLAYDPEQESLRRAFKEGGRAFEEGSDDGGEDDGGGLLTKKVGEQQAVAGVVGLG
jgi:protein KRI1